MSENHLNGETLEAAVIDSKIFDDVLTLATNSENITTLWLPSSGRTALAYRLQNKIGIPQRFLTKYSKIIFIPCDALLDLKTFEDNLDITLEKFSLEKGIMKKINDLILRGNNIYLIVDNFSFNNLETLDYLLSLKQISLSNIRYLFLGLESDFYTESAVNKDVGLVYHNIIKVPYFDKSLSKVWIDKVSRELKVELSDDVKTAIYNFSGGIIGLLKNMVRVYKRYQDAESSINSVEVMNYCVNLWRQFSKEEQNVIKNLIITGKFNPSSREFNYLKEHCFINSNNQIIGTWVNLIIGSREKTEFKVKGNNIFFLGVDLDDVLSEREKNILLLLCSQKSFFADRDMVGKIIWQEKITEKFSDWALDQIFSRLRRKLVKIGVPKDTLKTLKGKGFKMQNIHIVN